MRAALALSTAAVLLSACDSAGDRCTPAEPGPRQLTVCLSGDLDGAATLRATRLVSFTEGVEVNVVEAQGATDSGSPLGLRVSVAADEVEPGTYPVTVRTTSVDGGGAAEAVLPATFEDVRDYRGVGGAVVVETVAADGALVGRFEVELEDREGRRVDAVGRFSTADG